MNNKLFLLMFLIIFIPFITSAVPPQTNININTGLEISYPKFDNIQINQTFNLTIHVYNISDGFQEDTATCELEIYNKTGTEVVAITMNQAGDEYYYYLTSGNFSQVGLYSYNIYCYTIYYGGFVDGLFEVTPTGETIESPDTMIYGILLFLLVLFDLLIFYIISRLSISNERDEEGEIMQIKLQKYFKIVLIGVSYGLVLITLNLMNAVAQTLPNLTQFAGLFGGMFTTMINLTWIWTVCIILWLLYTSYKDAKLFKLIQDKFEEAQYL